MADEPKVDASQLDSMSFKEGLVELDEIVRALEGNQLELEQSIQKYERGVALLGALQKRLDDAQQKVTVLMGELEPENSDEVDTKLS
ncbi:MAG: exodeoxyribonuclease VII small subunit [Coriobacteriaceae bacterium]|nr:exodeoxyribonuclease VII small subunit [Coriobacteriaceae bacterium]